VDPSSGYSKKRIQGERIPKIAMEKEFQRLRESQISRLT